MSNSSKGALFFICDSCKTHNIYPPEGEFLLPYLKSVTCQYCLHIHTDIKEFTNFSKQTREYS